MKNLIILTFALVASFSTMAQNSVTFTEVSIERDLVWSTTYHLNADGSVFYAVHTAANTNGEIAFSNILRFKKTHRNVNRLHRRLFHPNERGQNLIAD